MKMILEELDLVMVCHQNFIMTIIGKVITKNVNFGDPVNGIVLKVIYF